MSIIAIEDIAYVRMQAPDLDRMEAFLQDFGLHRAHRSPDALYMRGHGSRPFAHVTHLGAEPASLGIGLQTQNSADLDILARHLGRQVEPNLEPGGGSVLRLQDPGGLRVDILHGHQPVAPLHSRAAYGRNTGDSAQRLGQVLRQPPGASHCQRLGHAVMLVPDFEAAHAFYCGLLGLRIADSYHAEDPSRTTFAFLHCDLGERYTDHHTIAIGVPPGGIEASRFDHIAFEVLDLDDLMAGHAHLQSRGHRHSWGVGRHVEGSQIFDYWRDPYGHKVEHWTDGDRLNQRHVPSHKPMRVEGLAQWAPPFNPEFFD